MKPSIGTVKLNTDRSLKNDHGSWGAAIRDHEGQVVKAAHGHSPCKRIDEMELHVVDQEM